METHGNGVAADLTGAALQNLLPAPADGDQAALAGTLCPEGVVIDLFSEPAGQIITERSPCQGSIIIVCGKTG